MNKVYLLLGSNMGNSFDLLEKALQGIETKIGTIECRSAIYKTEPWGFDTTQYFLNMVILCKTNLSADQILDKIKSIELNLGRVRTNTHYTSRTMDIDILFYNNDMVESPNLTIPHPLLHQRKFTLEPLNEIAAQFIHPVFKLSVDNLLKQCTDKSTVFKLNCC